MSNRCRASFGKGCGIQLYYNKKADIRIDNELSGGFEITKDLRLCLSSTYDVYFKIYFMAIVIHNVGNIINMKGSQLAMIHLVFCVFFTV